MPINLHLHLRVLFLFVFLPVSRLLAQESNDAQEQTPAVKKADALWNLDVNGSIDFPAADMAKRFGTSYRIGVGIRYKSSGNWIYGAKFDFITGNKMRDDSLLINMTTSQGGVISQQGDLLNVGLFLRGYMAGIQFGRIFPVLALNKNSGVTNILSLGFIQYKINIFDRDNSFPQLRDAYKKGYDRLTNGLYLEDFLGYAYYSKNKLINFSAGLNFVWGFTQGRRDYLYDLQRSDAGARNDLLLGFKIGWTLPIYRKHAEEVYY